MGKIKVTQEQAEALTYLRDEEYTDDNIMDSHPAWVTSICQPLKSLSKSDMAKILYGEGYEIESAFNVGDKVVKKNGITFVAKEHVWEIRSIYDGWLICVGSSPNHPIKYRSYDLQLATQEEIYWHETLGREFVGDFREGDVIITNDVSYRYSMDGEIDSIGEHTTKQWAEQGVINKIYPVESSKPYPQKEVE